MIEVGEYVRTKRGEICKVLGIRPELREGKRIYGHKSYYLDSKKRTLTEAFIVKHSKKLIDLIEVGDYVNGKEVIMDLQKSKEWYKSKDDFITCKDYTFEEKEIKEVVTKEQFESISYKVTKM